MKGLIIYKGKYNSTRQYAQWLAGELHIPLMISDNISRDELGSYDFFVLGSPVYMGKLLIKNWLKKNFSLLLGKKILLFVVCGTPAWQKEKLQTYIQASLPAEIRNSCETYFLPGRMIMKDLTFWDRFMMIVGAFMVKDPATKKAMLTDNDGVKKENLDNLIAAVRKTIGKKMEAMQKAS